jgi:hypothetical protein
MCCVMCHILLTQSNQHIYSQTDLFEMLTSSEGSSVIEWSSVSMSLQPALFELLNRTWQDQLLHVGNKSRSWMVTSLFIVLCDVMS